MAEPVAETSASPAPQPPPIVATEAEALRMFGAPYTQAFLIEHLARAEPLSFKPVGSTSTVFRAKLAAPFDAAFKAETLDRPRGPLAEIGAAAIARCLHLATVPPAVARSVPLAFLRKRLDPSAEQRWSEIEARLKVSKDGRVAGAFIYWITDLGDIGLNKEPGLSLAAEWLRVDGVLPEAERALAASVSAMLAYDYIIGNFDRWSGSNTKGNADRSSVYVRDHDLALAARLSPAVHAKIADQMVKAERTSRAFYEHAQVLSGECIEREVAAAHVHSARPATLSAEVLAGVFDRRDAYLSHVRALIEQHGEQAVLVFP